MIVEKPTKRKLPVRPDKAIAIIVHTTGRPDGLSDEKHEARCIGYYQSADGLGPHYFISLPGATYRFVAEDHVAYHAAIGAVEASLYGKGWQHWRTWRVNDGEARDTGNEWSGYRDWRDTWRPSGAESPLDLVTGSKPNWRSVGIELQQPSDNEKNPGIFRRVQYEALAVLLVDIAARLGIPIDRRHVLGHQDVNPMTRSTSRGGWDPGPIDWGLLWDLVGKLAC